MIYIMGVYSLFKFIEKRAKGSIKWMELNELAGKAIAIDTSVVMINQYESTIGDVLVFDCHSILEGRRNIQNGG